jgi:hypothetical protein
LVAIEETVRTGVPSEETALSLRSSGGIGTRTWLTAIHRLPSVRLGLVGQVLTFAAMIVPILFRQGEQIALLVFTSTIATAAVSTALLGYQFIYPVIRGPRSAATVTGLALTTLALFSVLILPLTVVEGPLGLPAGSFVASAGLLFTMGLYAMTVTRLVRKSDTHALGMVRLLYGVAVLVLTVVASVWPVGSLGLTVANALAYVVPVARYLKPGSRRSNGIRHSRTGQGRLVRASLRRSVRPTFSTLANGWAFFLPGLALPGLGAAAQPWAIVARICGGFSTLLTTIVSPPLEARMARAVRDRERGGYARARRSALLAGVAASTLAMVTGLALALYQNWATAAQWLGPVALATVLYWTVLLASAPLNRTPNFVGRDAARLVWDSARAALVTVAFLTTDGITRLMVIGIVLTVFGILLLPLTRYRVTTTA